MFFDKRGVGHIEVIMSFVLFIGFLAFAFYFFSPFQSERTFQSSLDYAFDEIIEETNTILESYSVVLNDCTDTVILIENPVPGSGGIKIKNISGDYTPGSTRNGNKFCGFESGENFITILISEEFPPSGGGCTENTAPCSNISSSEKTSVMSNKSFFELVEKYNSNYQGLKNDFNIGVDFGFSLIFDGTEIVAEREVPSNLEVVAKEDRVEVVTEEGVVFADLVVKVW